MIRNKNKFIQSYNKLCLSEQNNSSDTIFSYTSDFISNKFESILDVNNPRLDNIAMISKKSDRFKLLSIGKTRNYTLRNYSKDKVNNIVENIIKCNLSINDTEQKQIPIVLCGQNYDLSKDNINIWSNIPSLTYWVPRILLLQNNNKTTITHFFDFSININKVISIIEDNHKLIDDILDIDYITNQGDIVLSSQKFLTKRDKFQDSIRKIKKHINNSDVSKVVISNILSCDIEKVPSYSNLINILSENHPTCSIFYYKFNDTQLFIGASPETILKKDKNQINIDALAGSKPIADKEKLVYDKKIEREHSIVVNGIIDNLKSIELDCEIKNTCIYELKNIAHLKTEIISKVDSNVNPLYVLDALVPTAALSGYPKLASMDIIDEIEEQERGWYAGPIGWIDTGMNCEFYAALRSAYINHNKIYFYGGAGIVINSDANEEWDEIINKIDSIYKIING